MDNKKNTIYTMVTVLNTADDSSIGDITNYFTLVSAQDSLKKSYEYSLEYVKKELGDDAITEMQLLPMSYVVACSDYVIYTEIKETTIE